MRFCNKCGTTLSELASFCQICGAPQKRALWETDKPLKLVELYNTAGQYYATVLIAVVFAQFSVLTFLRGKHDLLFWDSPEILPIIFLIFVYCVVLGVGCYFGDCFLKFSGLLDRTIENSQFDPTLKKLFEDVGQTHLDRRGKMARHRRIALGLYVIVSVFALFAILCIT